MWNVQGSSLQMSVGDYGVALPFEIKGVEMTENDSVKIVIKQIDCKTKVLEKVFVPDETNKVDLILTAQESAKLPIGEYKYRLDWYQDGVFMYNIIDVGSFKVVKKA